MSNPGGHALPQPSLMPIMSEAEKYIYWTEYAVRAKRDNETYTRHLREDKEAAEAANAAQSSQAKK
ncbi:hypothetical protein HBI09_015870 [Parastagonospora nodorum]|nr:hypothetical protein HBI09_015870 [Parastagonospora nodorum]KAH5021815.1 hypothetical protein HBI77_031100 [Parastagonospora nodorum]KAH5788071.1 hypothetical protein HBI16_009750 [Parastagonospora nodorum]